jgi:hypothetical protein
MVLRIRILVCTVLSTTKEWCHQNTVATSQLLNALTFGAADETLSSRAFRSEVKGKWFGRISRPTIDALLFFDKDHCLNSFINEVKRRHLPKDFQEI